MKEIYFLQPAAELRKKECVFYGLIYKSKKFIIVMIMGNFRMDLCTEREDIVKEYKVISIIYTVLLIFVAVLCIGALIFIPINTYSSNRNTEKLVLEPYKVEIVDEDTRVFHFRDVDWRQNGNCLYFNSSHQELKIVADNVVLFKRNAVQTLWGKTTGFARELIIIPTATNELTVTVTACYPAIRDKEMTFYQGFSYDMFREMLSQDGPILVFSILNICFGLILFIYGVAMHKRTSVGSSMVYLAAFTIVMGIWALADNSITSFLIENRAACSILSFSTLSLVGIPLTMFVNRYLQPGDKYVHRIILGINIINIVLVFSLLLFGIMDMKETVVLTHISMLSACFYLLFSLIHMLRKNLLTKRFWVTVCSLLTMCPALAYSLYLYYTDSHNVDGYGNITIFVFISIFAIDVSRSVMKDIDAGKKAEIYHELAVRDMLTGCYNRNAYRNDTEQLDNLQDILLITCDLNNLKQCNDTLGHAYGDQYITDAAAILRKIFCEHGKVYRIGGDEFCIILPNRHKININVLLASLIEEQRIYNETSELIHIQIACGYAVYDPKTDSDIEDIRTRADEWMYKNKKELKSQNCVENKAVHVS
jgi:diguanylate cyclase (GGDEF)-like protein